LFSEKNRNEFLRKQHFPQASSQDLPKKQQKKTQQEEKGKMVKKFTRSNKNNIPENHSGISSQATVTKNRLNPRCCSRS